MKYSFPITLILLFVVSCNTRPDGKALILDYLQKSTNGMEYSIIEVSGPDSLYSPAERLTSLMLDKSRISVELSTQLADVFEKPSRRERIAAAQEVAALADKEFHNQEGFDEICIVLINADETSRPANRLGYRAKYKVDGQLKEDVFYLEQNKKAIGHTASKMMEKYQQLCDINERFIQIKSDAEEVVRLMQ